MTKETSQYFKGVNLSSVLAPFFLLTLSTFFPANVVDYFLLYYKNAEDIPALLQLPIIRNSEGKTGGFGFDFSLASNGSQPEAMVDLETLRTQNPAGIVPRPVLPPAPHYPDT